MPDPATRIQGDSFVTLHYRLVLDDGSEAVSTFDLSPATLQMGSGQLAEPLERQLLGMAAGESRTASLAPGDAFGEHNPRLVERIARSALPEGLDLRENTLVEFGAPDGGGFAGFCRELGDDYAVFDFNHPLAGKALTFEVKIIGVM
jgi:FKBP-type peptidyl-prolyl cis-trans isomerase SlpA